MKYVTIVIYIKLRKILIFSLIISYFLVFENSIMPKILLNNENYKISIFLPIYNKDKYLKRSITSIQKQSIKDIEIIAVNDCSTDNSLEILKEMGKNDPRIKIINNKNNHGLLYSRAMGILNSKGEYLMNLDPDDEFRGKNNLKLLYHKAKKLKVDFITFFIYYLPNKEKSEQYSKFNIILKQPELFESAFDNNNYIRDFYITNKFIKRQLLENVLNLFKNEIYGEKWNYHEDNIWSILIHKYANSSVFINKNIYYYYSKNFDSEMFNRGNLLELKNLLYRNLMLKKILKKKNEEKYLIAGYSELIDIYNEHMEILQKNKILKIKTIKELKELLYKYNLSVEYKKRINNLLNQLVKY